MPLDIISNFFNQIFKSLGITATTTSQKVIPSSGSIVYVCSDGTAYSSCSATKPKYCDNNGNLHDNYCYGPDLIIGTADDCDCPSGRTCQADGSCKSSTTPTKYNGLTIALDTLSSTDTPAVIIDFMKKYNYNALRIYVGWGNSFWTGNINDPMNQRTKDFIDELSRLSAENNFMVVSAVSDQLEPWKTFAHEEIQVGPNGEENNQGNWVCFTGPKFQTFEKNLIKTLVGIMEKYATPRISVDEIVFITAGGKPAFYCDSMKTAYKQATGKDIPIFSSTSGSYNSEQQQFIEFAKGTIRNFYQMMEDTAKAENPNVWFGALVDTYWVYPKTSYDTQPWDYYETTDEIVYEWFYAIQDQNWAGITDGLKRIKTLNPNAKHYFIYGTSKMTTIDNMRKSVELAMAEDYDGVFLYEYAKSKSNPFDVSDLIP